MKRVLICAGAHVQAESLARKLKMSPAEWGYVSDATRMRGLRGMTLLMFGSWESRKDLDEIMVTAKVFEMSILYINDGRM